MVACFCHPLSDNYVDLSDVYVDLSDIHVDLSDHYVDLSEKYHHNYICSILNLCLVFMSCLCP